MDIGEAIALIKALGGTVDFDQLINRPKYDGAAMEHGTNIPKVPEKLSDLTIEPAPNIFSCTVIRYTAVPASASAEGKAGNIAFDASYFYVCIADNTWRRIALTTF